MEFDDQEHRVYLNTDAENIIKQLNETNEVFDSIWHPEYANFMLECKEDGEIAIT